jgi:hypothetical protein
MGLKLNETHQVLVYIDDVNLLRDNINIIQKNTAALIDTSNKVDVESNTHKAKYVLVSRHQNVNRSFENVAKFNYFRMTVANHNSILVEIKSILNSSNACYHSVQNLLSSCLLSKNKN